MAAGSAWRFGLPPESGSGQFDARSDIQLPEDLAEVEIDRVRRQIQASRGLTVGQALGDLFGNSEFGGGEAGPSVGWRACRVATLPRAMRPRGCCAGADEHARQADPIEDGLAANCDLPSAGERDRERLLLPAGQTAQDAVP